MRKKALALAAAAIIASGFAGAAHADPGSDCVEPVDAFCTTQNSNGDAQFCEVYLGAGTPADDCYTAR